jgi:hypothetical protein
MFQVAQDVVQVDDAVPDLDSLMAIVGLVTIIDLVTLVHVVLVTLDFHVVKVHPGAVRLDLVLHKGWGRSCEISVVVLVLLEVDFVEVFGVIHRQDEVEIWHLLRYKRRLLDLRL